MIVFSVVILLLYVGIMLAIVYGFRKVPISTSEKITSETRFSIVIPFRNESKNLPSLLNSLIKLDYPAEFFEIILVNDASEDTSEKIIQAFIEKLPSFKLIQNKRKSNSPKKDAISEAIKISQFEWIVTTDADCEIPPNWLNSYNNKIKNINPVMVCGPVAYKSNGEFIQNFQEMDGLSLQAATIGTFGLNNPILCNGANLAYKKEAFFKANGFQGNDHIASGDDIFTLEKMKKLFPGRISFLKNSDAIVTTKPQISWKSVISQRIRWASKTSSQKNIFSFIIGLVVFIVNVLMILGLVAVLNNSHLLVLYLVFLGLKLFTDYLVLLKSAKFFQKKLNFLSILASNFVYAAVVILVVFGSLKGNYLWKGRTFKKSQ